MRKITEVNKIDVLVKAQAGQTVSCSAFYTMAGFKRACVIGNVAGGDAPQTMTVKVYKATKADWSGTETVLITDAFSVATTSVESFAYDIKDTDVDSDAPYIGCMIETPASTYVASAMLLRADADYEAVDNSDVNIDEV